MTAIATPNKGMIALELKLQKDGTYKVVEVPDQVAASDKVVPMSAAGGFLGGIADFKVANIPLGTAVVAGIGSAVLSEVLAGITKPKDRQNLGFIKLAGAFAVANWGPKWLGQDLAYAGALFMGYEGLRDILNLDKTSCKIANFFRKEEDKVDCDKVFEGKAAGGDWDGRADGGVTRVKAEELITQGARTGELSRRLGRMGVTNV